MDNPQRPHGVAFLSVLGICIEGMFLFLSGVYFFFPNILIPPGYLSDFLLGFAGALSGYVLLALGSAYVLGAREMWEGRNWARFLYALLAIFVAIANIIIGWNSGLP